MSRDIEKILSDYDEKEGKRHEPFALSDIYEIYKISKWKDSEEVDASLAIINALKVGYVIGHRRGLKGIE